MWMKITSEITIFLHAKLDQIQLMANDSCKMAWINLIYLRKNWQSEGQRINKSWQWLFESEVIFLLVCSCHSFQFNGVCVYVCVFFFFKETIPLVLIWLLWRQFVDCDDVSFDIFRLILAAYGDLAGSIQFLLIIQIAKRFLHCSEQFHYWKYYSPVSVQSYDDLTKNTSDN